LAIAEGAAQGADLDLQVRVFDEGFRPGSGFKLVLADYLTRAFDQRGKDVKGAAAEAHRLVAFKQQPLCREKPEWAEGDGLSIHGFFYRFLLDRRQRQSGAAARYSGGCE
jgi:hypothetical protein